MQVFIGENSNLWLRKVQGEYGVTLMTNDIRKTDYPTMLPAFLLFSEEVSPQAKLLFMIYKLGEVQLSSDFEIDVTAVTGITTFEELHQEMQQVKDVYAKFQRGEI